MKSRETSLKLSCRDSNFTRCECKSEALPHEPACMELGSFRVLETMRNFMNSQRLLRTLYQGVSVELEQLLEHVSNTRIPCWIRVCLGRLHNRLTCGTRVLPWEHTGHRGGCRSPGSTGTDWGKAQPRSQPCCWSTLWSTELPWCGHTTEFLQCQVYSTERIAKKQEWN